jgi:hypothetical protein
VFTSFVDNGEKTMVKTIEAVFDGTVFQPTEEIELAPNTPVRITVETLPFRPEETSFLKLARSLNLDGPHDWSSNLDEYLYGGKSKYES